MTQARFYSSTAASTTLTAGITPTAVSMAVASTTGFPASFPYTLILERDTANQEVVSVTAAAGTTLTIVRGQDGTSGIAHSITAVVEHGVSARDFTEAGQHVGGTTGVHGVAGALVGTTDTQVLTGKTIDGGSNTLQNVPESAITSLVTDLAAKVVKATLSAKGSLLGASAAATPADVPIGADALVLTADSTQAAGVKWATAAGGGNAIYGDGADGSATLDGTATVTWASKVGSVYTMTRNAYLTTLTINSGVTLLPSGFVPFVNGTLTVNGTIQANGGAASTFNGGAGAAFGSASLLGGIVNGQSGLLGATATVGPGTGPGSSAQALGGTGGAGGSGSAGAGGATGTVTLPAQFTRSIATIFRPFDQINGFPGVGWTGGQGGASGGGDNGGIFKGGGGGGGAGLLLVVAKIIVVGASGIISALGGAGASGTGGNTGGGGGGGGGHVFLVFNALTNSGSISVAGGAPGTHLGTGVNGTTGGTGTLVQLSNV